MYQITREVGTFSFDKSVPFSWAKRIADEIQGNNTIHADPKNRGWTLIKTTTDARTFIAQNWGVPFELPTNFKFSPRYAS